MHVFVRVRFGVFIPMMCMLVVLIMRVPMGVNQALVLMFVGMRFRQNQPGCDCHQYGGGN